MFHECCVDFSNVISKQDVKILAEADDQEVVREVQVIIIKHKAHLYFEARCLSMKYIHLLHVVVNMVINIKTESVFVT
jgi:hypothetical protein